MMIHAIAIRRYLARNETRLHLTKADITIWQAIFKITTSARSDLTAGKFHWHYSFIRRRLPGTGVLPVEEQDDGAAVSVFGDGYARRIDCHNPRRNHVR